MSCSSNFEGRELRFLYNFRNANQLPRTSFWVIIDQRFFLKPDPKKNINQNDVASMLLQNTLQKLQILSFKIK